MTKQILTNKNILLIVSGSIAAYKSPDIIRALQDCGASIKVIITKSGLNFITELTLETISKTEVYTDVKYQNDATMEHIKLAKWADVILVAPASANIISQIAGGIADNLATITLLASPAQIFLAPAMNKQMLIANATVANIDILKKRGIKIINSDYGKQACGDIGFGRLATSTTIVNQIIITFSNKKLLGKKILITAGATVENIDPVRFISNNSSGKMALSLANAAIDAGAQVLMIYGQIQVDIPSNIEAIKIISADDMHNAVMANIAKYDIFIAAAAVADYKLKTPYTKKIAKQKNLTLELITTKDILADVGKLNNKPFIVGFAAQTDNLLDKAQEKYQQKKCDLLVANDVLRDDIGFNSDYNEVYIFHKQGYDKIIKNTKDKIAIKIVDFIQQNIPSILLN